MEIRISNDKDYSQIAHAITNFNLENLPPNSSNNMSGLGFVIDDPKLGLVGGVYGKLLLGNCLSIEVLWVYEKFRNLGYASKLMHTIETTARNLGSHLSTVDTFDFQALGFYQKNGYEIFGVLDDCPCVGNKRYFLKKAL